VTPWPPRCFNATPGPDHRSAELKRLVNPAKLEGGVVAFDDDAAYGGAPGRLRS
jgi:hypothetical protein